MNHKTKRCMNAVNIENDLYKKLSLIQEAQKVQGPLRA